jgi:hypothetical protein
MKSKSRVDPTRASIRFKGVTIGIAAIIREPRDREVGEYEDQVTARIRELDERMARLATASGVAMADFVLEPAEPADAADEPDIISACIGAFVQRGERVTLERKDRQWGLFFARDAALIGVRDSAALVPLKDAPLDARVRFLLRSEEFVRVYVERCKERMERMKAALAAADRTLEALDDSRSE